MIISIYSMEKKESNVKMLDKYKSTTLINYVDNFNHQNVTLSDRMTFIIHLSISSTLLFATIPSIVFHVENVRKNKNFWENALKILKIVSQKLESLKASSDKNWLYKKKLI